MSTSAADSPAAISDTLKNGAKPKVEDESTALIMPETLLPVPFSAMDRMVKSGLFSLYPLWKGTILAFMRQIRIGLRITLIFNRLPIKLALLIVDKSKYNIFVLLTNNNVKWFMI